MAQMTGSEIGKELLDASDVEIAEAIAYAEPMVLRGLLYQLTADEEVAATNVTMAQVGLFEMPILATEEEVALLRRKATELLISITRISPRRSSAMMSTRRPVARLTSVKVA